MGARDEVSLVYREGGERERDRETERQRDRETERQRDRETERQRGRETERQRQIMCAFLTNLCIFM